MIQGYIFWPFPPPRGGEVFVQNEKQGRIEGGLMKKEGKGGNRRKKKKRKEKREKEKRIREKVKRGWREQKNG